MLQTTKNNSKWPVIITRIYIGLLMLAIIDGVSGSVLARFEILEFFTIISILLLFPVFMIADGIVNARYGLCMARAASLPLLDTSTLGITNFLVADYRGNELLSSYKSISIDKSLMIGCIFMVVSAIVVALVRVWRRRKGYQIDTAIQKDRGIWAVFVKHDYIYMLILAVVIGIGEGILFGIDNYNLAHIVATIATLLVFPAYVIADGIRNAQYGGCLWRAASLPFVENIVALLVSKGAGIITFIVFPFIYMIASVIVVAIARALRAKKGNLVEAKPAGMQLKTFVVLKHPAHGYVAVKTGFCWPAFFFTWIWAFVNKRWEKGLLYIGVSMVLLMLILVLQGARIDATVPIMYLPGLGLIIWFGVKGNEWIISDLTKRGYERIRTVEAVTKNAAITYVINQGSGEV